MRRAGGIISLSFWRVPSQAPGLSPARGGPSGDRHPPGPRQPHPSPELPGQAGSIREHVNSRLLMGKLVVSLDNVVIKEFQITKERTTLGRRPYNDIVIDNLAVSGEHA